MLVLTLFFSKEKTLVPQNFGIFSSTNKKWKTRNGEAPLKTPSSRTSSSSVNEADDQDSEEDFGDKHRSIGGMKRAKEKLKSDAELAGMTEKINELMNARKEMTTQILQMKWIQMQ